MNLLVDDYVARKARFFHILWEWPYVSKYWRVVASCMGEVMGQTITMEIKRCLINIWEPTDLGSKEKMWVTLGLMIAKRNIA